MLPQKSLHPGPLNQEYSMKCLIPQLLKRAGISITWNCSANRKLHCKTFRFSFYENLKKKNGYCALNLNGHIIQVIIRSLKLFWTLFLKRKVAMKNISKNVMTSVIPIGKKIWQHSTSNLQFRSWHSSWKIFRVQLVLPTCTVCKYSKELYYQRPFYLSGALLMF